MMVFTGGIAGQDWEQLSRYRDRDDEKRKKEWKRRYCYFHRTPMERIFRDALIAVVGERG